MNRYEAKGALNVSREPGPRVRILLMASSMVAYDIENSSFWVPSYMLCVCGKDRSMISHWLMRLGDHTELIHMNIWNELFSEGACYSSFNHFFFQELLHDMGGVLW